MSAHTQLAKVIDARAWTRVDFISDLHLQASDTKTAQAFFDYLHLTQAQGIFILGDLFEVWIGDDVLEHKSADFERECVHKLAQKAQNCSLYLLPGNRDFLLSERFFKDSGVQALSDPCVLETQNKRYLLSHGDELCLADQPYQSFRTLVRSAKWITTFLSQTIETRAQSAREMRKKSQDIQAQKKLNQEPFPDLDWPASLQWLKQHDCQCLIHGHTHKPSTDFLDSNHLRVVLSDWDAQAQPVRAQVLRLEGEALKRIELSDWQGPRI